MRDRSYRWLILLAIFFLSGCVCCNKEAVTPTPSANWKTIVGQVRYEDTQRTFVADVTIRKGKNAREYSLEIAKAGAVLLQLDRSETLGWAKGLLAHRKFYGQVETAPTYLQNWYSETTAALENKSSNPASGIQYRLQR